MCTPEELIESLRPLQEKDPTGFPCPRCGHRRMNKQLGFNAVSRRIDIYICSECGKDEGLRDMAGIEPIPFEEWGMVKGLKDF